MTPKQPTACSIAGCARTCHGVVTDGATTDAPQECHAANLGAALAGLFQEGQQRCERRQAIDLNPKKGVWDVKCCPSSGLPKAAVLHEVVGGQSNLDTHQDR